MRLFLGGGSHALKENKCKETLSLPRLLALFPLLILSVNFFPLITKISWATNQLNQLLISSANQ